jgi:uncharacterized protein
MKLAGEFVFDAGVQDVWDALFDPAVLAACLPGCEKLERDGTTLVGDIKVKIGPIQGKFTGKVDLLDQIEPTSYRMVIDGRGAQGFVKANATIALEPAAGAGGRTRMTYDSDAQVGGKLATVGERLISTSTKAIVKESLEGLDANIKIRVAARRAQEEAAAAAAKAAEPPPPPPATEPEYQRADAGKLAATVAKEVGKSMWPFFILAFIAIGFLIYALVR